MVNGFRGKGTHRIAAKQLRYFANKGHTLITKIRLTEGDLEAEELEEAIHFIESLADECSLLAW
jgi:hypothetical protein